LVRNTVIAHASLTERITTGNAAWANPVIARAYDVRTPGGAAFLESSVTQQASMLAYIDDFWLMLYLTLAVIPLLALIRPSDARHAPDTDAHAAAME
jgi:DHA2 family multidrug resistance protein